MSSPITTELVKELRDTTGISVMQCRKALEEANGDMKTAMAILKKNSAAVAEKKVGREAKDGAVIYSDCSEYQTPVENQRAFDIYFAPLCLLLSNFWIYLASCTAA